MIDVIIFSGQSNMQGESESRPVIKDVKNAYEYLYETDSLEPLNHPVGENIGYDENHRSHKIFAQASNKHGSLVPYFAKEYLKSHDKLVCVSCALGDSRISEWIKGTKRYDLLVDKTKKAIDKAKSIDNINHIYFVWLQGESDTIAHTTTKDYLNMLVEFKNDLKNDLHINRFGIIKVGYFYSIASWHDYLDKDYRLKFDKDIMKAQEKACRIDTDFLMLTKITSKLSLDSSYINPFVSGHFNNEALKMIGIKACKGLIKGEL